MFVAVIVLGFVALVLLEPRTKSTAALSEGCVLAQVCWMGNECTVEYLLSSKRDGQFVHVRVRDFFKSSGRVVNEPLVSDISVSCANEPESTHANAIEWTRWMAVCLLSLIHI